MPIGGGWPVERDEGAPGKIVEERTGLFGACHIGRNIDNDRQFTAGRENCARKYQGCGAGSSRHGVLLRSGFSIANKRARYGNNEGGDTKFGLLALKLKVSHHAAPADRRLITADIVYILRLNVNSDTRL
jgi:hypothetical protein